MEYDAACKPRHILATVIEERALELRQQHKTNDVIAASLRAQFTRDLLADVGALRHATAMAASELVFFLPFTLDDLRRLLAAGLKRLRAQLRQEEHVHLAWKLNFVPSLVWQSTQPDRSEEEVKRVEEEREAEVRERGEL